MLLFSSVFFLARVIGCVVLNPELYEVLKVIKYFAFLKRTFKKNSNHNHFFKDKISI